MKHLKAKDLLELLQANPNLYLKVVETKKHTDPAPTMAVLEVEKRMLNNAEEECILLFIEPNPDTFVPKLVTPHE